MPDIIEPPAQTSASALPSPGATTVIPASKIPAPNTPPPPAKEGSARERRNKEMSDKYGDKPVTPPAPTPPAKTETTPPAKKEDVSVPPPTAKKTPDVTDPNYEKHGWRHFDDEKKKTAALAKQLEDAKKSPLAEKERNEYLERIQKTESKLKEYEDEVRFSNFKKSPEYTKMLNDYQGQFENVMEKFSNRRVTDPATSEQRPIATSDILQLFNMDEGDREVLAKEKFGNLGEWVVRRVEEMEKLSNDMASSEEDARKNGSEREKQRREQHEKSRGEIIKFSAETWTKETESLLGDEKLGKYFKPVDGDEEGNRRLGKGFEFAKKVFEVSDPRNPKLTPEQRAEIVSIQSKAYHRIAAFGRLVHQTRAQSAEIESLKKELAQFKSSEPSPTGGTQTPQGQQPSGSARDRRHAAASKFVT